MASIVSVGTVSGHLSCPVASSRQNSFSIKQARYPVVSTRGKLVMKNVCMISSSRSLGKFSVRANAQAVSEDSVGEEVAPEEAAEVVEDQGEADFVKFVRDAYSSNNEESIASVEAQISAIEKDRQGLAARLEELTKEVDIGKDRFLRLNADFDNFRKRSDKEKGALATKVKGDVVEALLPMIDSFERAKSAIKAETEAEKKIDGSYQGIYKQFVEVMRGLGVTAVETVGKEFDPNVHDAIMREDSTEYADGTVTQEFRKGFVIGDKLLRAAMVKVSSGPGPSAGPPSTSEEVSVEEASDAEASNEIAETS